MTIVRTHYRYKRPPKRRKAIPLGVPQVVTISEKTRRMVPDRPPVEAAIDRRSDAEPSANDDRKPAAARAEATRSRGATSPAPSNEPAPTDAGRKSAIVTARRPGKRYDDVPEATEEEHRAIGDRADAMMREFKRRIAEKDQGD